MAKIVRISTDAVGRYLLTASKNKTAKLWDAASGELRRRVKSTFDLYSTGIQY